MKKDITKIEQKYLDYITAHPGVSAIEIVDAWKAEGSTVSARLSTMYGRGFFNREKTVIGRGITYRYWVREKGEVRTAAVPVFPEKSLPVRVKPKIEMPKARPAEAKAVPAELEKKITEATQKPSGLDLLVNVFVDALACTIADRLKPLVIEKLTASVKNMTEEITREIPRSDKIKLKRVLVCGCLDRQGQMLKQEYTGMLDIDWVTVESSSDVWKGKARNANAVIVMTDFVSHKHIDMIKETGAIPEIHKGGYAKLRDRLIELSIN